jgi:hypothetical protein
MVAVWISEVKKMNGVSPWKNGFVDLAAILFVIGGVVSLIITILMIPITSIYPFVMPTSFSTTFLIVLAIGLVCSLGAIYCYSLAIKRMLSEAGMRGIIFGALLLIFSLGLFGTLKGSPAQSLLTTVSALLILTAGAICFVMRHTVVSASSILHRQPISQRA